MENRLIVGAMSMKIRSAFLKFRRRAIRDSRKEDRLAVEVESMKIMHSLS